MHSMQNPGEIVRKVIQNIPERADKQEQLSSQITMTEDVASWSMHVLHFNISLYYKCNLRLHKHSSYFLYFV